MEILWLIIPPLMWASVIMIFIKAGEAWWKALIPVYNILVLLKIAGKSGWYLFLFLALYMIAGLYTLVPDVFDSSVMFLLSMITLIVGLIATFFVYYGLAESFGMGKLFAIGLLFLSMIFFPIMGFGLKYYGAGGSARWP